MPGMPSSTPKLKQWMIQQVDSDKYPGLVWEDRKLGMFRIPWKHANHQDYRHDKDAAIFEAWAKFKGAHKGRHRLNPRTWKSRLRCALHKSSDFEEVPHFSKLNIFEPFKVYKIVDDNPEKKNLPSNIRLITVKTEPAPDDPRQAGGSDPGLGYKTSAREEDSGEIGPQQWNPPPSAEDRLPSAIPLCSVKVGGCQNAATANRQPSSPSRQLGMTEKQVKSETPSLDSQQMESDSGCDPGSGCETSAREEGSGDSTLSQCTLTPSTEEKLPSPVALSSVKVERSDSVGMETSQPSSPISRLGPTEEQVQSDVPVPPSQEVKSKSPSVDSQQMESDSSCDPSSGSEMSAQEEGPGEITSLDWSLTPSTEVPHNYTINITSSMPPSQPEKGPNSMFISFCYGGVLVSSQVTRHGCKISSSAPPSRTDASFGSQAMEKLRFPPTGTIATPEKRKATEELLTFLERGVMLDSNTNGIFIQRLCQGRVFWTGPCASRPDQPNKLERDKVEKLFDRKKFDEDLELCQAMGVTPPQYQVTLCFGEELTETDSLTEKLITVQIHQVAAKQLVDRELELQATTFILSQLAPENFSDRVTQALREASSSLYGIS